MFLICDFLSTRCFERFIVSLKLFEVRSFSHPRKQLSSRFVGMGVFGRKSAPAINLMCDIVRFSAEESQFMEMTQCVWPETFCDSRGGVAAVCFVARYRRRLILPSSLAKCNGRRYTSGWSIATSASSRCFWYRRWWEDVDANTDADVGVGANDDEDEIVGLVFEA